MKVIREAHGDKPQAIYIGDRYTAELDAISEEFVHWETGEPITNFEAEARLEWLEHRGQLIRNTNGLSSSEVHAYNSTHRDIGMVSLIALRPTPDQLETFAEQYPHLRG